MKRSEMTCANCIKLIRPCPNTVGDAICKQVPGGRQICFPDKDYCWQGLWENPNEIEKDFYPHLMREDGEE